MAYLSMICPCSNPLRCGVKRVRLFGPGDFLSIVLAYGCWSVMYEQPNLDTICNLSPLSSSAVQHHKFVYRLNVLHLPRFSSAVTTYSFLSKCELCAE
jgi:hypothetical protein